MADWPIDEVVALLRDGAAPRGSVAGPMAEVVRGSTRHLAEADLRAVAVFLKALPRQPGPTPARREAAPGDAASAERGGRLYARHCAECHGDDGRGAEGAYPPLAGNRAVLLELQANVVRMVLAGGFPPATAGNPRPYGMPPFFQALSDAEVADVATFVRSAWGNAASAVTPQDVLRWR